MLLGKRWLLLIGNRAKIRPLEMGRKSPDFTKKLYENDHEFSYSSFVKSYGNT